MNKQNTAPAGEVIVTLESAIAALTDAERTALLLDPKKLAAFKKSMPKAKDLKVKIMEQLAVGPTSDAEMAKVCGTTVKTIQSYYYYLKHDHESADIQHKADPSKPKGIKIYKDGGLRMLKADFLKTLEG